VVPPVPPPTEEPESPEPAPVISAFPEQASPAPELAEPLILEPVSLAPAERAPESELAAPALVPAASRERMPAPAAIIAADAPAADAARWHRSTRQWRTLALLMTLITLLLAGLLAALRNFPERLPSAVRLQFPATAAMPPAAVP